MVTSDPLDLVAKYSPSSTGTIKKSEMISQEKKKLESDDPISSGEKHKSTYSTYMHLIERVKRNQRERAKFVASHVDKGIAFQIRALRDRQQLSQEKLAAMVGMNQNAISRLESPQRGRPTITTLKRIAEAFDVALIVRFVPFSKLVKWVSGVPFVEEGLSTEALGVPNFDEESESGEFKPAPVVTVQTPQFVTRNTFRITSVLLKVKEEPNIIGNWAQKIFMQNTAWISTGQQKRQLGLFGEEKIKPILDVLPAPITPSLLSTDVSKTTMEKLEKVCAHA